MPVTRRGGTLRLRIPENLTQQAYRAIQTEIITGQFDRRKRLTEEYFASRFGISKSPIREALNRLEAEGLISILPRRGAFVIDFSIEDVREIYELREALEACVVRNLELDRSTAAQLNAAVDAARKHLQKRDKANYIRADSTFHRLLTQGSKNARLRKILDNMHNQTVLLRHRTFELSSQTSVRQHAQILAALEKGERQRAARLMVEHIRTVRDRLLSHLATQPVQRATTPDDGNPVRRRPGLEGRNGHPGRLRKRKPTPTILSSPAT